MLILVDDAAVSNPGRQPVLFVLARVSAAQATGDVAQIVTGSAQLLPARSQVDPELDDAWYDNGCHLNPGNPACVIVGVAAECAITPAAAACDADSDGDSCIDVAEIRSGFDPFEAKDCLGSGGGKPAINCLFLSRGLACDGSEAADVPTTHLGVDPNETYGPRRLRHAAGAGLPTLAPGSRLRRIRPWPGLTGGEA